jgi:hypothetical protein
MNVLVKNTFVYVENESVTEMSKRSERRNKTLPREWKCSFSDVSTEYSPRSSLVSSLEDECIEASEESCQISNCSCTSLRIDAKTDAVTSAVKSFLTACLPAHSAKVEKDMAEGSMKVLIHTEPQDGTLAISRCYQVMQGVKQHLSGYVAHSEGLSLLSARVQKEDYGYSMRSSVACIPADKENQMCWDVLRKGSCPRRKFCQWYHPQTCDVVKFKVVIRCCQAKAKPALAAA